MAAWMFARVAMPNATSTGEDASSDAASDVTRAFHSGLPPWARSRMPSVGAVAGACGADDSGLKRSDALMQLIAVVDAEN